MARLARLREDGFELECGEAWHEETPATFWLPDRRLRDSLPPGSLVRLMFRIACVDEAGLANERSERMWVVVEGRCGDLYRGVLDEGLGSSEGLEAGREVYFEPRHVIGVVDA